MNCKTSTGTGTFMSALDGIYMGLMNIQSQGTAGWERVEGHLRQDVTMVLAFILPVVLNRLLYLSW
jgi:hypothetical protein